MLELSNSLCLIKQFIFSKRLNLDYADAEERNRLETCLVELGVKRKFEQDKDGNRTVN